MCREHGIFQSLYTDNGSAFASHAVSGGTDFKFRNKAPAKQPTDIGFCKVMGIGVTFALPRNAKAKIAERTFAALSRAIDDRPEFANAHAGHSPGAAPAVNVLPVPVNKACEVIKREIDRHNDETGRRSQGARGRSYAQVFRDGLADQVLKKATVEQLYSAGLIYRPVAVDRVGQIRAEAWIYGGPNTQEQLLPFHGAGQRVLFGRDPDDFEAPGVAYDYEGRLIAEQIEPVRRGVYRFQGWRAPGAAQSQSRAGQRTAG